MKRLLILLVVFLLPTPALAGEVTARVKPATCDRPSFRFRLENTTNTYRKFTVVLYKPGPNLFLRDKVPAHGGIRGVVNPDWSVRRRYEVDVFTSWQWRPRNEAWVARNWMAGAWARLNCG